MLVLHYGDVKKRHDLSHIWAELWYAKEYTSYLRKRNKVRKLPFKTESNQESSVYNYIFLFVCKSCKSVRRDVETSFHPNNIALWGKSEYTTTNIAVYLNHIKLEKILKVTEWRLKISERMQKLYLIYWHVFVNHLKVAAVRKNVKYQWTSENFY